MSLKTYAIITDVHGNSSSLKEAIKTGFTKHQVAGLISSLEAKGVLYIEYRHPMEGPDLYYLSEGFINFIARANIANGTGRYVFAREAN